MKYFVILLVLIGFAGLTIPIAYAMHTDDGAHTTPFRYPPPLKQLNAGTPIQDIQCNEGKFLIHKRVTLSPACVSDKASNDLIFPPYSWAKLRIGMPAETITQQKMCLWHPDVKLVQRNCSGFDLIEFEKYYLMNCVELAKDAIDENSEYSNNDIRNYVSDRLTTCTIQEEDEVNSDSCDQLYDRFTKGGPYLYEKFKNLAENKLRNCVDYKDLNDYEMRSPGFILHENPLYVISDFATEKYDSERLNQVLRLCENIDAQYLGALSFDNSTHHIDSQTCTWRLVDEN